MQGSCHADNYWKIDFNSPDIFIYVSGIFAQEYAQVVTPAISQLPSTFQVAAPPWSPWHVPYVGPLYVQKEELSTRPW